MNENRCVICSEDERRNACERYLLTFLLDLQKILDDQTKIEEHFARSIFNSEQKIDQISCTGLTLMHVNLLGGREESAEQQFVPSYDEPIAVRICQTLLKFGASPHGNVVYEMRPIHIATRRQWMQVVRVLLEAGVNPNLPERDIYASRPIDVAVLYDDPPMIQLLHSYGASLHGHKSMFHLIPLAEAFTRGYFETFEILLQLGARPCLDLGRNTFRSFGTDLFLSGAKGRGHFIQLLYEHGGDIESEFKLHAIRIEADGIIRRQPEVQFSCDPICIAGMDLSIFSKWICETRSLKALCRLRLRRYYFQRYTDGFKHLRALQSHDLLNQQLFQYLMFNLH